MDHAIENFLKGLNEKFINHYKMTYGKLLFLEKNYDDCIVHRLPSEQLRDYSEEDYDTEYKEYNEFRDKKRIKYEKEKSKLKRQLRDYCYSNANVFDAELKKLDEYVKLYLKAEKKEHERFLFYKELSDSPLEYNSEKNLSCLMQSCFCFEYSYKLKELHKLSGKKIEQDNYFTKGSFGLCLKGFIKLLEQYKSLFKEIQEYAEERILFLKKGQYTNKEVVYIFFLLREHDIFKNQKISQDENNQAKLLAAIMNRGFDNTYDNWRDVLNNSKRDNILNNIDLEKLIELFDCVGLKDISKDLKNRTIE